MKFDTIIIGGGLAGLTAGLALLKAGQKVALVSDGQSALHFASGSFDLLGYDAQGQAVANPVEAIAQLNATHPYSKVSDIAATAQEAQQLLAECGLKTKGDAQANHYRLTPMGALKPTWLTIDDFVTLDEPATAPWKKVLVANIMGYLDFPSKFVVAGLRHLGVEVDLKAFTTPELTRARKSPSEMRATNISKVLTHPAVVAEVARELNTLATGYDAVLVPAVAGMRDGGEATSLKEQVDTPLYYVATLPPSVPGVRTQMLLNKRFAQLGGTFLTGDQVTGGKLEGDKLMSINTAKLEDTELRARNYVLATGSFLSHGLAANYERVYEPVLGLDVDYSGERKDWSRYGVFNDQPYMHFGVATDAKLHVKKDGKVINNCYAAGAVLSGNNRVKMADGAGVDMLTALQAAKNILQK